MAVGSAYTGQICQPPSTRLSEIRIWLDEVAGSDDVSELFLSQCVVKAWEILLPRVVTRFRIFAVIPTTKASSKQLLSHLRRLNTSLPSLNDRR